MRLLSKGEAAERLGVSPLSLGDKRYRARIGLPAVKVGRHLGFTEGDVEEIIVRGREKFPVSSGRGHD